MSELNIKKLIAAAIFPLVATIGIEGIAAIPASSTSSPAKFPSKGMISIGKGPVPLLVHYVDGTGKSVKLQLRDLQYEQPQLTKSKELQDLAKRPCGRGDVVVIRSRIAGAASGSDAAGIGRFVWQIEGRFTTDGERWQFEGKASPRSDLYDFNKETDGSRAIWAEVLTRIGASFSGKSFKIQIDGSLPIGISGICGSNTSGTSIA